MFVSFFFFLFQPAVQYSRDDSAIPEEGHQIKCESSPPTPHSIRLERVAAALAQSGDER